MKKITLNLAVLLIITIAFSGCKKDKKDDETTKNFLKVDGTDYDLSKGFLINYGIYGSSNNIDLVLISSGITVHEVMGLPDSVSGTGNAIYFELYSTSGDKLQLGDYIYNDSGDAGTFDWADYLLNWNATQLPDADFTNITSGTVKVINNGTEYELSFSGKDSNNKTISGYYKGSLKWYDDSGKKKS